MIDRKINNCVSDRELSILIDQTQKKLIFRPTARCIINAFSLCGLAFFVFH